MQTATDLLRGKAREYELKSANEAEKDELAREQGAVGSAMPTIWATVAVVLYEVAEALEDAA